MEDVELIETDLSNVSKLFHADGEGLPLGEINVALEPLSDLLDVMQLDTAILVTNYKQVWGWRTGFETPSGVINSNGFHRA